MSKDWLGQLTGSQQHPGSHVRAVRSQGHGAMLVKAGFGKLLSVSEVKQW